MDFLAEELQAMHDDRKSVPRPLGDKPLIVLSAGAKPDYPDGLNVSAKALAEEKEQHQADLARLSRNSRRVMAKNSAHEVHLYEPNLVVAAVHDIVEAVRQGKPLTEMRKRP